MDEKVARTLLRAIGASEALAGAIFCRDFLHRRWCFRSPTSITAPSSRRSCGGKVHTRQVGHRYLICGVRNPLDAGPFHRPAFTRRGLLHVR